MRRTVVDLLSPDGIGLRGIGMDKRSIDIRRYGLVRCHILQMALKGSSTKNQRNKHRDKRFRSTFSTVYDHLDP